MTFYKGLAPGRTNRGIFRLGASGDVRFANALVPSFLENIVVVIKKFLRCRRDTIADTIFYAADSPDSNRSPQSFFQLLILYDTPGIAPFS